jgi:hypothetical protein
MQRPTVVAGVYGGKVGGGKMKAVVPANLLCSNEPRKFCDSRLSAFYMHGEGCAGDSYDLFMREVTQVGFTSNHRVITSTRVFVLLIPVQDVLPSEIGSGGADKDRIQENFRFLSEKAGPAAGIVRGGSSPCPTKFPTRNGLLNPIASG